MYDILCYPVLFRKISSTHPLITHNTPQNGKGVRLLLVLWAVVLWAVVLFAAHHVLDAACCNGPPYLTHKYETS